MRYIVRENTYRGLWGHYSAVLIRSSPHCFYICNVFAAIGLKELPVESTPLLGIFWVTMACFIGAPLIGWIINLVAMKFYPLTKEKMEEIQEEIAAIKAKAMAEK